MSANAKHKNRQTQGQEIRPRGEVVKPTRPRVKPSETPDLPFIGMEHVEVHPMKLPGTVPAGTMKSSVVHFQPGDELYDRLRPCLNSDFPRSAVKGIDRLNGLEFAARANTECEVTSAKCLVGTHHYIEQILDLLVE